MSFDTERLFELLPTIYRVRDANGAGTKDSLHALVDVIAGQVAVLEEDLAQLYDDQFIETCAEWVAPYIGDLIGYRTLYGLTDKIGSPRAEVANTIAYRRRKGTASMLEQVARDVTGWDARAVEYFQLLATTQYLNHIRPSNVGWVNLRRGAALARIDGPFDTVAHTADVRRIARRRGRHNIPSVGLHLWRIRDFELAGSPAVKLVTAPGDGRYLFSPLGANAPLFNHTLAETTISHIAERENVPQPITRRELWDDVAAFYPSSLSIILGTRMLPASAVAACDLSDSGPAWAYTPTDRAFVDPVLGRLSLPPTITVDGDVIDTADPRVTFHYGSPAEMGGGTYGRTSTFNDAIAPLVAVAAPATIGAALGGLAPSGIVEIAGNDRFLEGLGITAAPGARIEVRAAEGARPTIELSADFVIDLAADAEVTLNGLLLVGAPLRVPATATGGTLRLRHCTLVPGLTLNVDGSPGDATAASLIVEGGGVTVEIEDSIVGSLRVNEDSTVRIARAIVDAADPTGVAFAATDDTGPGGELEVVASTVVGKVHARILSLVSNSLLVARLADADTWLHPVDALRRQDGCIRFSFVPPGSRTPRRHHCVPADDSDAARVQPQFTTERYGRPAYLQLSTRCAAEILTGADDESELGAYHGLFGPQRETNLEVRLDEYLRFGLEAGIFHAS